MNNFVRNLLWSNFDQDRIERVPVETGCYRLLVDGVWIGTVGRNIEDEIGMIGSAIDRGTIRATPRFYYGGQSRTSKQSAHAAWEIDN
jgi:hypothetical protein